MKKHYLFRVMKLLMFFMLIGLMHVSATTHSQIITIRGKLSLVELFAAITEQTGYEVGGYYDVLQNTKPIAVHANKMPLDTFLETILRNQPLEAEIMEKTIIIKRKIRPDAKARVITKPPIAGNNWQDSLITASGTVRDTTGQILAGASISLVSRPAVQTTTDAEGRFILKGVRVGTLIEISFLGYTTKQIKASPQMAVSLSQSNESVKEIVVTGLFERKAESFTGSTATYTQQDLLEVGNSNIIQSLANLDPSFRIVENLEFGSDPNRLPEIQMRGQTGLPDLNNEYGANPNLPLFILDGFETDLQRVIDLDMYLVKSITLLKDAASKAVYGSRAANGVVVIETKMPPAGKLQVSYNFNLNIETPDLTSYNLTNAWEKLDVEMAADPVLNQLQPSGDALHAALQGYNVKRERILKGVDTYWLSQPLRNGYGQRHSVNVGGGTPEFRYNVELGYNNVVGVMQGSERNVYSGGMTLMYRFNKISVSNILRLSSTQGNNSPFGSFEQFALLNPYEALYDPLTGNYARTNPMFNGDVGVKDFTTTNLVSNNLELIWQPLRSLRVNGRLSLSKTMEEGDIFLPATHNSFPAITDPDGSSIADGYTDPNAGGQFGGVYTPPSFQNYGRYDKSSGDVKQMNITLAANYNKIIGNHNIYVNVGTDANELSNELYNFRVTGFPNPNLDFPAASIRYAENSKLGGGHTINRDMGVYGAVNYALSERYLLDGTYRLTRSSQFGKNDPWGRFWSVGLGWNLHHEPFIKSLGWFDQLRLTANTGFTGTQALITNATLPTYGYNLAESYFNTLAAMLQRLANPDLRAQRRQDHNISLSTTLLNNALNIVADYYVAHTDGLLTDLNTPLSNGFTTYKANLGKSENRGIDLRMNYRKSLRSSPSNFIGVSLTVGHNQNILKELSESLISYTTQQDAIESTLPKVRFAAGQSMNAIWAVPSTGIDPATGQEVFIKKDGTYTYIWDVADQVVAGENLSKVFGNFGFSLGLNGWQFSTLFAYNLGGQRYNQTLADKVENASIATENVDRRIFTSRWREAGDITQFKSITDLSVTYPTTRFVQDWNEISIASINLSYDLERLSYIRSVGIKRLRASLITNNPMVFSSIRLERGTAYPFARTFSLSLQTTF